ncbi:cupredoxin domain-containing protein [Aquibacillus rhizosphaerae]|uniref:Cytochrome C oxidase subunit II n=1 Tax=Aquibacillus rhizosphaerae TaxID=3051431 RepID=A0ABT7L171_9BACI|nr:cytochrome C oxidase subunit II [Aquibacillus sp. LR5S19]MDL4839598.1 cytochrome C oxidase subunit II [Aquibacillus sp. LR5S19]
MLKKSIMITLSFLSLLLLLVACGGNEGSGSSENLTADNTIELVASNWEFDQDTYTVPAGNVGINLINEEGFHGIKVEGTNMVIEGEGSAVASLEPGEYTIRCSVPCGTGHTEMTAMLIVE